MEFPWLSTDDVPAIQAGEEILLLDARPAASFAEGFIPGSVYISPGQQYPVGFHGMFAGKTALVVVVNEGTAAVPVAAALNGTGFTQHISFLEAGGSGWQAVKGDMVITIEADELAMDIPHDENLVLIDVRTETEFAEGHIKDAQHLSLEDMGDPANIALIPEHANVYLYCSNGQRAMTAASLLKIQGLHNLRVVAEDWETIRNTAGLETEKLPAKLN